MFTKLPLILCFFYCSVVLAQSNYRTTGIFNFIQTLPIPDMYECGPGQLTKDNSHFILGLTQGDFENVYDLVSNIYLYDLEKSAQVPVINSFNLPSAPDSVRYFQCTASENEQVLVYVVNELGSWNDNQLGISEKRSDGSYSPTRMLTEINDLALSDAYPWISDDGLRLYYCKDFTLNYTERSSLSTSFSAPVHVKFSGEVNLEVVSVWLTPDEKTMFLIGNNQIYKCSRKSKKDVFSFPVLFSNEFKDFYFIAGLSFATDKKTMFLYYSDESTQQILKYQLKSGKAWK